MDTTQDDQLLEPVIDKVYAGQRLSYDDALLLFHPEANLHTLGLLADHLRRARHGRLAYYNINAHVNPTNVCVFRCPLCAYSRNAGDADAFVLSCEAILAEAEQAAAAGCTELHIVGGIHPEKPYRWYRELLEQLHRAFPRLHLKAWTAVEIAWLAEQTGWSDQRVLEDLVEAGLGSLPGGGAEIFDPGVRSRIAPRKANADRWLAVHRAAHRLGIRSNATMLYGHVERPEHRVDHLLRLRQLQDETGGFQAFVPLAFHPEGTGLRHCRRPTALDDLRVVAASRMVLDNFPHIKAYWISLGVPTAQVALAYGANDLDGTVRQEKIHHLAGSNAPEVLSVEELRRLIEEAGCQPVERDTLYRPVQRQDGRWWVETE